MNEILKRRDEMTKDMEKKKSFSIFDLLLNILNKLIKKYCWKL